MVTFYCSLAKLLHPNILQDYQTIKLHNSLAWREESRICNAIYKRR